MQKAVQFYVFVLRELWQRNCNTDLATSSKRTNNNSVYSKYPQKFIYTHS